MKLRAAAAAVDVAYIASQRVRWACLTLSLGAWAAWHSMHEGIAYSLHN